MARRDAREASRKMLAWRWLLALALLAMSGAAWATTTSCIGIASLPAELTAPGRYCLQKDFDQPFTTGNAIGIGASDVVLDCNGHRIRNSHATSTPNGIGTYLSGSRGVVVRNCVLEGFYVGIYLGLGSDDDNRQNVIEGNTIDKGRWAGMYVGGSSIRIERNRITAGRGSYNGSFRGIQLVSYSESATGNVVRDNLIQGVFPEPGEPYVQIIGIEVSYTRGAEITGNVLTGIYARTNNGTVAIEGYGVEDTTISRNVIMTPPPRPAPLDGVHYNAIYLNGTVEQNATNVCRDNIVGHYDGTPIVGCVLSGNTTY
jgi:hypothetical protein